MFMRKSAEKTMKKYAFIGVGNMAGAIIHGMPDDAPTALYDKLPGKTDIYTAPRFYQAKSIADAVNYADFIVFSVKPQNFSEMLGEIASSGVSLDGKTFLTIAAGITIKRITDALGQVPCIRVMPNTPLMIGKGVTALTRNEYVSEETFEEAKAMFSAVGSITVLPESEMNEIISVTSSSPAYIYLMIKALYDGAKAQGLDKPDMLELVCRTVIGSAEMVLQSGKTPDELIKLVTSPNGTTERAMKVLYDGNFEENIIEAMKACTKRAAELSGS